MTNFNQSKIYSFRGNAQMIEDYTPSTSQTPIFLGKFIQFVGRVCGFDWQTDCKAQFENGIISSEFYDQIYEHFK